MNYWKIGVVALSLAAMSPAVAMAQGAQPREGAIQRQNEDRAAMGVWMREQWEKVPAAEKERYRATAQKERADRLARMTPEQRERYERRQGGGHDHHGMGRHGAPTPPQAN